VSRAFRWARWGDLIGAQGAAAARVLGPAKHPGLEEGAIDDQLPAAFEKVEQANLALGPLEFVRLLDGHPWHPPAFGGQGVAGQSNAIAIPYVTANDNVPTSLRLLAHCRALLRRLVAGESPRSLSCDTT
jgi:hypothetical protein